MPLVGIYHGLSESWKSKPRSFSPILGLQARSCGCLGPQPLLACYRFESIKVPQLRESGCVAWLLRDGTPTGKYRSTQKATPLPPRLDRKSRCNDWLFLNTFPIPRTGQLDRKTSRFGSLGSSTPSPTYIHMHMVEQNHNRLYETCAL